MKTLKFLFVFWGLIFFVGCSKDDTAGLVTDPSTENPTDDNNSNQLDKIVLSASTPASPSAQSTRVAYEEGAGKTLVLKWQKNSEFTDSFSIYDAENKYLGDFEYSGDDAQLSGDFTQVGEFEMTHGNSYTAVFPAVDGKMYPNLDSRNSAAYLDQAQVYKSALANLSDVARLSTPFTYYSDAANTISFSHDIAYSLMNITLPAGKFPRSVEILDGATSYTLTLPNDYAMESISAYIGIKENLAGTSRTLSYNITDQESTVHTHSAETSAVFSAGRLYDATIVIADQPPAVVTSYYEQGVVIDGITYDKNTNEATLVDAAKTITANGVYFVKEGVDVTVNAGYYNRMIIIGDKPETKPKLTIAGLQRFANHSTSPDSGLGMIYKNMNVVVGFDGNAFVNAHAIPFDYWVMEDCEITTYTNKPLSYFNLAGMTIKKTIFKNNIIRVSDSTSASVNIVYYNNMKTADIESIEFANNLIFSMGWEAGPLVFVGQTTNTPNLDVKISNNTFIDYYGTGNGMVYLPNARNVEVKDNIFWASGSNGNNTFLFRYTVASDSSKPTESISGNVFFGLKADAAWFGYSTSGTYKPSLTFGKEDADIFDGFSKANVTFNKKPAYESKGSSLH